MSDAPNLSDDDERGCHYALLIIDMINGFDFPDGERLRHQAGPVAERIAGLAARARAAEVPVIYVNDNFGRWRSDFRHVIQHVCQHTAGAAIAERLAPGERDYFVLKPRHSGFLGTSLEVLLAHLRVRSLIVTGITGDLCVLFTAMDAYMRGFELRIPADCVASVDEANNRRALDLLRESMRVDTSPAPEIELRRDS
ncbi:cysteine hydrolase family protein [Nannocystis bainbridge]|uniref:Cysteine hydrolase n=1 Tax=Nannocystis bainbridge TaxID=2995303 RepID=A0ABT5E397_9BACT|nr:isochorismatase family cysteine hydrolase [Nannocystis bainbridge]MDC0720340.1 cysteine hydrolase [Nannocystis bainbridge]